jgi:hypothetical protein
MLSGNALDFLFRHPIVGGLIMAAVFVGVVFVLSRGRLGRGLSAILRALIGVFTTPFAFLQRAQGVLEEAGDAQADYDGSRVFMLFKLSRVQYFVVLIACVLTLSAGITASVMALYPHQEFEAQRLLSEQVAGLEREIGQANERLTAANAPGFSQGLQTRRDQAQQAFAEHSQSTYEFVLNADMSTPLLSDIASAGDAQTLQRVRDNIDDYMADCPRGPTWRAVANLDCNAYRAFATEFVQRKLRLWELEAAAREADAAFLDVSSTVQRGREEIDRLQGNLEEVRRQRATIAPFNRELLGKRAIGAALILFGTIWSVVVTVWVFSVFISLLDWLVLFLRARELTDAERLRQG